MSRRTPEDIERRFHEQWLGMVQPIEGLVVSVPVLTDAQCAQRHPPSLQHALHELAPDQSTGMVARGARRELEPGGPRAITDLNRFLGELLQLTPDLFDSGASLPDDLALYVAEGGQVLRPTLALRKRKPVDSEPKPPDGVPDDSTPASRAGAPYEMLVWDLCAPAGGRGGAPCALPLDKPERVTGEWEYPPSAKFVRLLQACRVPIGVLTNRTEVRLIYAPHGQATGHITFRIDDMTSAGGRPVLDAFVMLLSAERFFGVQQQHQLPQLLRDSRLRQVAVTNRLAEQVFEALELLLAGFEVASSRNPRALLDSEGDDPDRLYRGLLTVLLRLVFLAYAEDRGLLPVEKKMYERELSVLGLFSQLTSDRATFPDSMNRRFGAWSRLLTLFRAVYFGVSAGELKMPARHGDLFDPRLYPFLEGWPPAGGLPVDNPQERGAVQVPTLDDETVYEVLKRLLILDGQRLSYRSLDVEQIGSVYEAVMGYHVRRLPAKGVCLRPHGVWVSAEEVLEQSPADRASWLEEFAGLDSKDAKKVAPTLKSVRSVDAVDAALESLRFKRTEAREGGSYVLHPGAERRRTSTHYTPRSLSEQIVRRTLEPLLVAMGDAPSSEQLLNLKVCDPAMGSGAFLVAACRFLGDQVVAAWTREGKLEKVGSAREDVVTQARRLVAQRCLYGVDKNPFAVMLAKLSLWMVTLAKDQPFTFLDHALRCGDSLVGLSEAQIVDFHWDRTEQLDLCRSELEGAHADALKFRERILGLADAPSSLAPNALWHEARID